MKKARRCVMLMVLLGICCFLGSSLYAQASKSKHHIYLLIGQSNMAGRSPYSEAQANVIDRCYLLNGSDEWEPARNPLNLYSTVQKNTEQMMNPGYTFAPKMLAQDPTITLGIVCNARGATKIEQWAKGYDGDYDYDLYEEAIRRTRIAMQTGTLKGILWHQGESNCYDADYLTKLTALIADLRADLGYVPFVAGQITQDLVFEVNHQISLLPGAVPLTSYASSDGLTTEELWHFHTPSMMILGERYATEMIKLQGGTGPEYTLTYSAGPNGSISGATSQTVSYGDDGTEVTAVPDSGYHFLKWSDGNTTAARRDTNVTTNISVTANFSENGVTYELVVAHGSGDGNYEDGTAVSISADAPASGYHFVNWTTSDGGSFANANSSTTTYTMPANAATVTANYEDNAAVYYTLTYTAGPHGSISGTSPQTVAEGADGTTVSAIEDAGYHFVEWSDGVSTLSRTDTNVTSDIDVTASFASDDADGISYDSSANTFLVRGYTQAVPCTLEELYIYDQDNGPLNKITRSDQGTYYEYTLNASVNVGSGAGGSSYLQIGHNTGGESKYNDEVLIITGNIIADDPNSGNSYITVGSSSDNTLNPTIKFNCSSDGEFYIGRAGTAGHLNYYNCTLESNTGHLYNFGGDAIVDKNDTAIVNVTLSDHQTGYWSDYQSTTTITDSTLNSAADGYYSGHTATLLANGVSVTGGKAGIHGSYHSDLTITGSTLTGTSDEAFYTSRDIGVKIGSSELTATGSNKYAVNIEACTDDPRYIRDCSLTSTNTTYALNFGCYNNDGENASLEVTNTLYDNSSKTENVEAVGTLHVDRNWYLDVRVEDASGNPIQGATVSVSSSDGGEVSTGYAPGTWVLGDYLDRITGTDGHTSLPSTGGSFILRDYRRTSAGATEYTYTIAVSKSGYNTAELTGVNPDSSWYRSDIDAPQNTQVIVLTQTGTNYELTYTAGPNGSINGATTQTVASGADGTEVTAVPDTGYHFVDWSDGVTTAARTDTNVTANISVTANFANDNTPHSADTDGNWSISQTEVNSFIASYSNNNNTVATANGDITPGRITLREVVRVIYLYNNGGAYQGGKTTVDTYDIAGAQGDAGAPPPPADNDAITVVNSADSGAGSFRDAIANAAPGDTITFDESLDKIVVASEIVIDKSITIDGNGATIVCGNSGTRIFKIYSENSDIFVSLLNIGIVDADNSVDEFGGAIYNNGENLTLENCLLNNNANTVANGKGGAIYTSGSLTVNNCVFTDNSAEEENDIYSTNDNVVIE